MGVLCNRSLPPGCEEHHVTLQNGRWDGLPQSRQKSGEFRPSSRPYRTGGRWSQLRHGGELWHGAQTVRRRSHILADSFVCETSINFPELEVAAASRLELCTVQVWSHFFFCERSVGPHLRLPPPRVGEI